MVPSGAAEVNVASGNSGGASRGDSDLSDGERRTDSRPLPPITPLSKFFILT
jgi:hypothetical protein